MGCTLKIFLQPVVQITTHFSIFIFCFCTSFDKFLSFRRKWYKSWTIKLIVQILHGFSFVHRICNWMESIFKREEGFPGNYDEHSSIMYTKICPRYLILNQIQGKCYGVIKLNLSTDAMIWALNNYFHKA